MYNGLAMIEVRGLTQRLPTGQLALDDVSFKVSPGETYCLLGAPGAGKSTAIGAFWSGIKPTAGMAFVAGIDVARQAAEARRHVTLVLPHASFYSDLPVWRNVDFFVRLGGASREISRASIENALRGAGVPDRNFGVSTGTLSRGQSVLTWLAIAALRETPAIILDEPTLGVAPRESAEIQECVGELRRSGKALLLATSDVAFATMVADRIGILRSGRLVVEKPIADVLSQRLSQFYVEFAGAPAVSAGAEPTRPV